MPHSREPTPTLTHQPPEAPELVKELTFHQFQAWRHHPITRTLLQDFLPAWRRARGQQALNAWIDGTMTLTAEQVVRGQIMGCLFLENLTLDEIQQFYGVE